MIANYSVPLSDTIKRNNVLTYANRADTNKREHKTLACRDRIWPWLHNFSCLSNHALKLTGHIFRFENHREPPSLADRGTLRSGSKSDILECLNTPNGHAAATKQVTFVVLARAAVIHMVRPTAARTFSEYVSLNIILFIEPQINESTEHIDAVWDNYPEVNNLTALTQQGRGNGPRTRISYGSTPIPKHEWNSSMNEKYTNLQEIHGRKLLLSTYIDTVLSNLGCDITTLHPCNHAEADIRIFLHLAHAAMHGHGKAYTRTVDSDFVVLQSIILKQTDSLSEIWLGFGCGKHYRDIPIHIICSNLGPSKSLALPLFHSLTGCDTASQFLGCGKKRAWAAWKSTPELTDTLVSLTHKPALLCLESEHMQHFERFVVLMYSKGCTAAGVNEAWHHLFTSGSRALESILPTQAALFQHAKRSLLQASFYWGQATLAQQDIHNFSDWGWEKDNNTWQPLWTTLSDASTACAILLHCGCLKACIGMCKCKRAGVWCTTLCKCEGGCINNERGDD